ncbi:MAG TPA: response regulator [Thermoanaerobaculia bacterium]
MLVVEDDAQLRQSICTLLEDAGYTSRPAENGEIALERAREERPCVILLDLMMPIMNGWEFRSEQLQDPKLSSIPVVIMTADGRAAEKARTLHADYLRKPIHLDALLELVNDYCGT